jgi:5'-nucleotidase
MHVHALLLALALAAVPPAAGRTLDLRVVAINDFHGNLEAVADEQGRKQGGAIALAATLAALREGRSQVLFVSSGDLIGASPLPSALAHDEPTLALFRHLGLQANTVGNHELDGGLDELRRQQALAGFPFLSANLVAVADGKPVFAPYRIVEVEGVRVAFVGATVRNALKPLEPALVPGLRIDDEAQALNAQAAVLRAQGVHALVALLHEGAGAQNAIVPAEGCGALAGPARTIAERLDPDYDLVLSAHTHALYACRIGGRWLTQGGAYGKDLTVADLRIDRDSGEVLAVDARNEAVRLLPGQTAEAGVAKLVDEAVAASSKIADTPVAMLREPRISAAPGSDGRSELGQMVAKAQLSAASGLGAQLACTNPSSVPHDLVASRPGKVATYADVRAVQPYGNRLKLRRLSGATLRALLEQQWRGDAAPVWLSCSRGLGYRVDASHHLVPGSLEFMDRQFGEADTLVVAFNSYLARGGQGFSVLAGTEEVGDAGTDLEALLRWLRNEMPPPDPCLQSGKPCTPERLLAMPEQELRQFPVGLRFQCPVSNAFRGERYFRRCERQALRFARKLVARFPDALEPADRTKFEYRSRISFYLDTFSPGREEADAVGYLQVRVPLVWKD